MATQSNYVLKKPLLTFTNLYFRMFQKNQKHEKFEKLQHFGLKNSK